MTRPYPAHLAHCWLDSLGHTEIASAVIPGDPIPKGRPRWNGKSGKPRTPARTKQGEHDFAWRWRQAAGPMRPDGTSEFGIRLLLVMGDEVKPDVDNLEKLILDSLQGVVWVNDRQVTTVCKHRIRGSGPRTEIAVYRMAPQ